jgi:hypothetical protein
MGMMTSQGLLDCSRLIFKYYVISWALIPNLPGAWVDSYENTHFTIQKTFMGDNLNIIWFQRQRQFPYF